MRPDAPYQYRRKIYANQKQKNKGYIGGCFI